MKTKMLDYLNESLLLIITMLVSNMVLFQLEIIYGVFHPLDRVLFMMPWALSFPYLKKLVWKVVGIR